VNGSNERLCATITIATVERSMSSSRRTYDISINGRLTDLASEFSPHSVSFDQGVSVVRAREIDQAALHGLLHRTQSLGLELLEVRIVD
jgi:hypothetical protein